MRREVEADAEVGVGRGGITKPRSPVKLGAGVDLEPKEVEEIELL
jgi:hypothetical protein